MATMVSGLGGPAGYGENVFSTSPKFTGNNDDGAVAIDTTSVFGPGGMNYFGTSYTSIYLNSNGVISFGAPQTAYVPNLAGTTTPLIAPFWSDININAGGEIYWDIDPVANTITMTWLNVRPYSGTGTNSFQVVLTDTGGGNFSIEYIYGDMNWSNGGSGIAQTGYTNGGGTDVFLDGSGNNTELLNYETNNFGGGDPNGTLELNVVGGVPSMSDRTVTGTSGDDLINSAYIDPDGDSVGAGNDAVNAGAGNDTIISGAGNDTIDAGTGNDLIDAGIGNDSITAGDGNDTILGGAGADTIDGGAGIDTVDYTASSAAVNVNLAAGTASGGDAAGDVISNVENLTGSSFNDSLTGNTGANQLLGGAGNDSLFGGAGNDTIDGGAGTDSIRGGTGNDSLQGGTGNDTIYGGGDNDTIDGGANNDLIYGDGGSTAATNEHLSWSAQGADGTNIAAGFTQNTGTMNVNVGFRVDGNAATFAVETTDIQYTGGGPYSTTSSGFLFGNGDLDTSTTTLNFSAASGGGVQDEVSNVSFRVNDIDWGSGNHRDIVTVTAFNAAGNAVTVNITPGAGDTLSGNTVSGGDTAETSADAGGSALFSIAGPVARIVIDYNNGLGGTHGINVTDVHFTTIPVVPGNDSILGGSGNDTLFGEAGADTLDGGTGIDSLTGGTGNDALFVSQGDVAYGGDGEDNFYLTDLGEAGAGTITIDGGNSNEPGGDTLHLNGLVDKSTLIKVASPDDPDAFNGSVTMLDGTVVNFSRIERIICFTLGTMILTPFGERAIETLRPGDLVITRDHGPQPIRWLGNSTVPGLGELAPITIDPGVLDGATRQLQVSPQHRFLFTGYKAELLFGTSEVFVSAKHLVNGINVRQEECAKVAYLHLMLDQHEVIYADGTATESFFAGDAGVSSICDQARNEMFAIFPELRSDLGAYGNTARICLKAHESRLLIQPQMDFGTLAAA